MDATSFKNNIFFINANAEDMIKLHSDESSKPYEFAFTFYLKYATAKKPACFNMSFFYF